MSLTDELNRLERQDFDSAATLLKGSALEVELCVAAQSLQDLRESLDVNALCDTQALLRRLKIKPSQLEAAIHLAARVKTEANAEGFHDPLKWFDGLHPPRPEPLEFPVNRWRDKHLKPSADALGI